MSPPSLRTLSRSRTSTKCHGWRLDALAVRWAASTIRRATSSGSGLSSYSRIASTVRTASKIWFAMRGIVLGLWAEMDEAKSSSPRHERRISSPKHRAAYAAAMESPAKHKPRLVTSRSVAPAIHGTGPIGRFNSWLAVHITSAVGTMWAAYLFVLIAFVSLPQALHSFLNGNTYEGIAWLSQSFLQLVLLPIIIVGQNVISASQDARAEADHITLTTLHAINVQQLEMLEQQREMLLQQRAVLDLLQKKGITMPGTTDSIG